MDQIIADFATAMMENQLQMILLIYKDWFHQNFRKSTMYSNRRKRYITLVHTLFGFKMDVTKKELRENIKFFTETDPIGKIVYERLGKL